MTDLEDILVVDDNALDRELVRRLLPRARSVREAATAAEAEVQLGRALPSLVLLDNRLPDADGIDVLPLFAEHHIPVVMLTEIEAPEVIVVAMQRGAGGYLVKGALTREVLSRAITDAVEKASLRKQLHEQHLALAEQAEALEARNREIRALAAALTLAEQAERHRITEFLHDDVQQLLVGAQFHLQVVRTCEPAMRLELLDKTGAIIDQALLATRNLVDELTPPVLENELDVALQWLADHMSRLHHVAVRVAIETYGRFTSRDLRVLVIQIVRELVFNAIKHAGVKEVRVRLYEDGGRLAVTVEDEGGGFDTEEVQQRPTRGFGLFSVLQRLELVGGAFEIVSRIGQGTRATITLPA